MGRIRMAKPKVLPFDCYLHMLPRKNWSEERKWGAEVVQNVSF
jgi:hypothetical protein